MRKRTAESSQFPVGSGGVEAQLRHILVAVVGQTPQVVTETLYVLMVQRQPPVRIAEVYVLTTGRGARLVKDSLLDPRHGQFHAFCREYDLPEGSIRFDEQHVVVFRRLRVNRKGGTVAGAVLQDIRSGRDNADLARQIFGFIRRLTSDPGTALHCSLAGGRKTMSAYLALAMTLYGRRQDRLSHVLVSAPFESNPRFFFPPRRHRSIAVQRGGAWDVAETSEADVELAEIPFLRLREVVGEWVTRVDEEVERTIQLAQLELDRTTAGSDRLAVDLSLPSVRWAGREAPVRGILLALLLYFVETKARYCRRPEQEGCAGCTDCFVSLRDLDTGRFVRLYRRVYPFSGSQFAEWHGEVRQGRAVGSLQVENLLTYISRLNRALSQAGFPSWLRVLSVGSYGAKHYGFGLDKDRIEWREAEGKSE